MIHDYLPICREDMEKRGWDQCDFVYVTGDAYVDHNQQEHPRKTAGQSFHFVVLLMYKYHV